MAVLEVHNNLVMILVFFVFVFLVGWGYFVCLVGFYLTDESFVTQNGSKVCVCVPLSLSLLVRSVSRCNVWVLSSVL